MMDIKPFYPADWQDDQTMNVLFSPFRENRNINPQSWDRKMKFWSELIVAEIRHSGDVMFDVKHLPHRFRRKDKIPVCLERVLDQMLQNGQIQSVQSFESGSAGWLSWGVNTLVAKPLSWTFGKIFGSGEVHVDGEYLIPEIIKDKCVAVLERHYSSVENELTDNVVELGALAAQCRDIVATERALHLVLIQLTKDKKVSLVEGTGQQKLVRFAQRSSGVVKPTSVAEEKILQLKKSEDYLKDQIQQLSRDMERCRLEAKDYLKQGLRNSAKNCLRRKKSLERKVESREVAVETINVMLQRIKDAESNKMILDAYSAGNSVFKEIAESHGLNSDNIDEVMSDVQEVFDMQAEINESLNLPGVVDPSLDVSTAELEDELEDILRAGKHAPHDYVSSFDDLRLHDDDELELPAVPTFNPATPPKRTDQREPANVKPVGFSPVVGL